MKYEMKDEELIVTQADCDKAEQYFVYQAESQQRVKEFERLDKLDKQRYGKGLPVWLRKRKGVKQTCIPLVRGSNKEGRLAYLQPEYASC